MKKKNLALVGWIVVTILGSAVLGFGVINSTITKDGWSGNGTPGMLLLTIFAAWCVSYTIRAIRR